jgi:hypothetical protein
VLERKEEIKSAITRGSDELIHSVSGQNDFTDFDFETWKEYNSCKYKH